MTAQPCPICTAQDEDILLQTPKLRVIAVHNDSGSPAFCRVIWHGHIAEITDLSAAERGELMEMVYKVEPLCAKCSGRQKSTSPAWAMSCRTCIGILSPALKTMRLSLRRFGQTPSENTV